MLNSKGNHGTSKLNQVVPVLAFLALLLALANLQGQVQAKRKSKFPTINEQIESLRSTRSVSEFVPSYFLLKSGPMNLVSCS